ncbi:MAG: hypothetical protein II183_03650, partial [Elusimicrobiaceae bacterium]|nr:hypothetical protein [Elusimicrobiaceae bacterium]
MILYSLGFLFCLGLLFYFIAKYKESDLQDEEFSWENEFEKAEKETSASDIELQDKEPEKNTIQDFI